MNKKKMVIVFIMTILGVWLASFAINYYTYYYTYYMGPNIFQVLKYDDRLIANMSILDSNAFNSTNYSILTNLSEEEIYLLLSYPRNVTNITTDELKEYPALEKAINGVDCIEPGPNSFLCKAASTEEFNKIKKFIDSKRTFNTCFKFEQYENCYSFHFVKP